MMDRKVFIVKGHSRDAKELSLDRHYSENYRNYFQSVAGGAYKTAEIIYLEEPTADHLDATLQKFKLDFSVVILIGHGATQDDKQLFKLNKNEIIRAGQIHVTSKKMPDHTRKLSF